MNRDPLLLVADKQHVRTALHVAELCTGKANVQMERATGLFQLHLWMHQQTCARI